MRQKMTLISATSTNHGGPIYRLVDSSDLKDTPPEDYMPSDAENVNVDGEIEFQAGHLTYGWPSGAWEPED
jgi:hypothetical protein